MGAILNEHRIRNPNTSLVFPNESISRLECGGGSTVGATCYHLGIHIAVISTIMDTTVMRDRRDLCVCIG